MLEANWRQIRNEGVALLTLEAPEGFADESEKLRDSGDWKQFELFAQGRKNAAHCTKVIVYLIRKNDQQALQTFFNIL